MVPRISLLFLFSLLTSLLSAQNLTGYKNARSWCWIHPFNAKAEYGVLQSCNDSSVSLLTLRMSRFPEKKTAVVRYDITSIEYIETRMKNSRRRGLLIGGLCGLGGGIVAGVLISKNNHGSAMVGVAPVLLTGLGIAVGTLAGSTCIEIPIHGRMDRYQQYRPKLEAAAGQ
ncbi:MAG TPA: hypothetical protein PKG48_03200 [Bacteroidales bacterium]|nr:hypothetical protein [Bacteroidales bacterium]